MITNNSNSFDHSTSIIEKNSNREVKLEFPETVTCLLYMYTILLLKTIKQEISRS